jgi:hypothetical protein
MSFARFMSSGAGRGLRAVAGVALAVAGFMLHSAPGIVLGVVGVLLIVVASINVCPLAPIFGGPFSGARASR